MAKLAGAINGFNGIGYQNGQARRPREGGGRWRFTRPEKVKADNGARLRGNVSFQHATDTAGNRVENSPRVLGRVNFSTPLPTLPLRLGVELAYDGKRRSPAGSAVDAYWLSNLHLVAERWIPGAEVSLSVLNLFDEAYAHPSAGAPTHWTDRIAQDGRSLRLKFDYRF